jgi:hypothetical protein
VERRGFIQAAAGALLLAAGPARARTWDFYLTRLAYESGDWEYAPGMAAGVLGALHASGSLRADPRERVVALDDTRMLAAPFCFLGGRKLVQFNAAERRHLERYVHGGGFLLADGSGALFARSCEAELARLSGGRALRPLAPAHPLFSSFYRLEGEGRHGLRALEVNGRIRVLYSTSGYARDWEQGAGDSLRLAVNIIHYALGA